MRLIDADALVKAIDTITWYSLHSGCLINGAVSEEKALYKAVDIYAAVDNAHTIEDVPVRHGKWKKAKYIEAPVYVCSECGNREPLPRKFCPECGLMMEKEERS